MSITPIELRKAEFKKNMMGYNTDEVDSLLSSAADALEDLRRENSGLKEKVKGLEEKLESYQGLERTLNETLIMAQKASDSSRQNAQREADLIISQAEIKADKMVEKAKARLLELNVEIEELEHQKHAYMMRLRSLVASQWKMLQDEETEEEKFRKEMKKVQQKDESQKEEEAATTQVEKPEQPEESVEQEPEDLTDEPQVVEQDNDEEDSGAGSESNDFGAILEQNIEEKAEQAHKLGENSLLPEESSDDGDSKEEDDDSLNDPPKLFWGDDDEEDKNK